MKLETIQSLDTILESAVIVSWTDLMKDAKAGLIHLECALAPDRSLEYLKVWSSVTRGHWLLACAYWMSSSTFHGKGIHFENGYRSEGLTQNLDFVMQHQQAFTALPETGRTSLLQISTPSDEDSTVAAKSVKDAFCRINSFSAEPSVA